jgi:phenylpropionate dioxygenase-like ring-hydroxylating dioxygenase large terminal subunit
VSFLCLARDIKEGAHEVFDLFGESYIAKKEKGKITVGENRCSHRGMRVANCGGKGPIKCQYHGQRFNYDRPVFHHEFGEFVFVPTYLGQSQPLKDISPLIGEEFGRHEQFVKAPFHLWMQNTADPNHLTYAHKESFAKLFDGHRPESVYISEFESSYTMRIKDDVVDRYRKHFAECGTDFYHYLAFPNLSVTSFLGIFYSVESANPLDSGCLVTTRFFIRQGLKPGLLAKLALEANQKILSEDKDLVEKWAEGYRYDPMTNWLPGEDRIKRYADEIRSRGLEL